MSQNHISNQYKRNIGARTNAFHDKGVINDNDHDYLHGALRILCKLLLRQKIDDFKTGSKIANYLHPNVLSKRGSTRRISQVRM